MTLGINNTQRDIPQSYVPQTTFQVGSGTGQTPSAPETAAPQTAATRAPTSTLVAQNTAAAGPVDMSKVGTGSYSYYFERGIPFDRGSPLHGHDPARVATDHAARLGTGMEQTYRQANATMEQVRSDPNLSTDTRQTLLQDLERSRAGLQSTNSGLSNAVRGFEGSNTPESRRALVNASRQGEETLNRAGDAIAEANGTMRLAARQAEYQAGQVAERRAQGQQVTSTLAQGTQAATTSGSPQATLQAADSILAMRSTGDDNRDVGWRTGDVPLSTVAGHVQTLHGQNAEGREATIQQLDVRAQELERQSPGSTRTPGSPAWEMAHLSKTLRAAGTQADAANTSLTNALSSPNPEERLPFQTSRAAEAVAFEARVQADARQALENPGDSTSTNLAQAQARVATMADTFSQRGAASLHGQPIIELQAQTMQQVMAGRQAELRGLDGRLEAEQRSAGGPAPGEPGSRAGEAEVLRTAAGQEVARLERASDTLTDRFSDSTQSWESQARNVAEESTGRSLRHSDGLFVHADAYLGGGTGLGNAQVMGAIPGDRQGDYRDPNASTLWLQGRATQASLETGLERTRDIRDLATQMPEIATRPGGRFSMANVDKTLTEAPVAQANLDRQLDRLETGRAGESTMEAAREAVSDGGWQLGAVNQLAKTRDSMMTELERTATIAQTSPEAAAMRSAAAANAEALASGRPEPSRTMTGGWLSYGDGALGGGVTAQEMRVDQQNLSEYAQTAGTFITQRQTELQEQLRQGGDADGKIARELHWLDLAQGDVATAQRSLREAAPLIDSDPTRASREIFGAAAGLGVVEGFMRQSIETVRSEPR